MVKTESELDRLKREVNWLQRKHVLVGREHREEMVAKDELLRKRQKRIDALERESAALKKERHDLQITLRAEKDELERSGLEIGHLKEELMRLNAAEQRVRDLEGAVAGGGAKRKSAAEDQAALVKVSSGSPIHRDTQ